MSTCLETVVDRGLNELPTAKVCTVIVKKANSRITNSSSEDRSSALRCLFQTFTQNEVKGITLGMNLASQLYRSISYNSLKYSVAS